MSFLVPPVQRPFLLRKPFPWLLRGKTDPGRSGRDSAVGTESSTPGRGLWDRRWWRKPRPLAAASGPPGRQPGPHRRPRSRDWAPSCAEAQAGRTPRPSCGPAEVDRSVRVSLPSSLPHRLQTPSCWSWCPAPLRRAVPGAGWGGPQLENNREDTQAGGAGETWSLLSRDRKVRAGEPATSPEGPGVSSPPSPDRGGRWAGLPPGCRGHA